MGRRALRKPDPSLDIRRYYRELRELGEDWRPADWFPRGAAPLEVEMGSGKGLFLRRATRALPEHNFIGLEIAGRYARFAAAQLARAGSHNGLVLHGDGLRFFQLWLPDRTIRAVHVYFPDPWWKQRHRKRRVMNETFLADVERTLEPGGRLHFWTDVEEYFRDTLELIAARTNLQGPLAVEQLPADHDLDYRTHFERRMRLLGQPVYRSEFVQGARH